MDSGTFLLKKYVRSHDVEAFAALAHRYAGMVYATSLRVLRNSHDAEEVAQECFLNLARKPDAVHSSLAGWLHNMALNKAKNLLKSEQRRKHREHSAAQEEARATPEPSWDEIAPLVDQAIADLPDELGEPIIAHFLQKQSHAEVAKSLNVSRSTITRRIQTGIEALRAHFDASGVTLSAAILSAILYEKSVCAAPASLTATIGKMALAGVTGAAKTGAAAGTVATGAKATAGGIAMKLAIPVVIGAAAVGGGIVLHNVTAQQQPPPTPQAPVAAVQEQPPVSPQTSVSAQPPASVQPPAPPAETKETMFAKGTVTDEVGNPVADAIVYATRSDEGGYAVEFETRTDANGRFAFEGLTPSEQRYSRDLNYIFYANKAGFAWGDVLLHIDRSSGGHTPLPLPAGVSDMEITLSEPGSLAGRILTKAGQPVPDAVVFPCSGRGYCFPSGSKNLPFLSAITDEEGKFRIDNLPLGRKCGLEVEAAGFATITPGRYIEERPNHLPLLTVGDETTEIRLAPESRIAGHVVYQKDGAPVAGVTIEGLEMQGSSTYARATTTADGSFLLKGELAAGHYRLMLWWQSGTKPSKRIPGWLMPRTYVDVAEGETLEGVVIKVLDSVPATARILDKRTGEPVPAGSVWVKARGERGWSSGPQFAQSGCTIPLEPKRDYQLSVHADGYERWESAVIITDQGGVELPDILLEPRETPAPTPRMPTRWRLLVVDEADRPVPEATVRLMSQRVGITGPDGRVQYQIRREETARVLIWEPVRKLVATYAPHPVPEGEQPPEVKVVLHRPGTIVGTVKDTLGRPVRNDRVAYGRGELRSIPTDETGRYVIHNVPPGKEKITLYTSHEGYGRGHGWVREVNPGETVTVPDIVLPIADQIITGRVTDTEGKPVAYARVTTSGRGTTSHCSAFSDADGRFALKGVVLEDISLDVDAEGFAPLRVQVPAGEFKDVELRLQK